ncbi:hypothetical protein BJ508DRAFT_311372 [Ascobolus immersus RN42]|uniref:Uncharacterized protein n=1 Tax=Ascobolus immersus RN42 TaxID=1160509 RepID=A0A3N4I2R8_ASCIM|nr:hypothetical protein BJ508DRAFT_311372 [Ascobolus immersus RN42]
MSNIEKHITFRLGFLADRIDDYVTAKIVSKLGQTSSPDDMGVLASISESGGSIMSACAKEVSTKPVKKADPTMPCYATHGEHDCNHPPDPSPKLEYEHVKSILDNHLLFIDGLAERADVGATLLEAGKDQDGKNLSEEKMEGLRRGIDASRQVVELLKKETWKYELSVEICKAKVAGKVKEREKLIWDMVTNGSLEEDIKKFGGSGGGGPVYIKLQCIQTYKKLFGPPTMADSASDERSPFDYTFQEFRDSIDEGNRLLDLQWELVQEMESNNLLLKRLADATLQKTTTSHSEASKRWEVAINDRNTSANALTEFQNLLRSLGHDVEEAKAMQAIAEANMEDVEKKKRKIRDRRRDFTKRRFLVASMEAREKATKAGDWEKVKQLEEESDRMKMLEYCCEEKGYDVGWFRGEPGAVCPEQVLKDLWKYCL